MTSMRRGTVTSTVVSELGSHESRNTSPSNRVTLRTVPGSSTRSRVKMGPSPEGPTSQPSSTRNSMRGPTRLDS